MSLTTTTTRVAAAAIATAVLAGCGGQDLAQEDPEGYAACSSLIRSSTTQDSSAGLDALLEAGRHAQGASTEAIRATAKDLVAGTAVPDVNALRAACSDAGVEVPAAVTKSS